MIVEAVTGVAEMEEIATVADEMVHHNIIPAGKNLTEKVVS